MATEHTQAHTHMRRLIYQQKEGCVNKWMQHGEFPLSWHVLGHFLWAVLGWDFGRRLWVWYDEGLAVATHPFGSFSVFNHSTCNPFSLIMSPRLLVYTYIYTHTIYYFLVVEWLKSWGIPSVDPSLPSSTHKMPLLREIRSPAPAGRASTSCSFGPDSRFQGAACHPYWNNGDTIGCNGQNYTGKRTQTVWGE
jgi:hypothetical protein